MGVVEQPVCPAPPLRFSGRVPAQLLEEHQQGATPDLLREMIATFANAMMSAQADQVCGASWGERSEERNQSAQRLPGAGVGRWWSAAHWGPSKHHSTIAPCLRKRR